MSWCGEEDEGAGPQSLWCRNLRWRKDPALSGRLRVKLSDEIKFVRDQAQNFVPIAVEAGEEALHRRLEVGEGRKVLIVDRLFLEQPPEALDQVQVRRVSRQVMQFNAAIVARQPGFELFRMVVLGVVQYDPDRTRRWVLCLQVLE